MIQLADLNTHITRQSGTIQSPHDPCVFIQLSYGQPPVLCQADGTDRELSLVEFANTLLSWTFHEQLWAQLEPGYQVAA